MTDPLSDRSWSVIEEAYLSSEPIQHAVIDDFLTPDAFRKLQAFLLEHSGWSFNRAQAHSLYLPRPDAPHVDGLARSLCEQLPRVLAGVHLVEHWAFLHPRSGGLRPHFDVGAVTVNLWITDERYNCTPDRGGLILYAAERPAEVPADMAGRPGWADEVFARVNDGREIRIPYKGNRAVLFKSSLFHASDEGEFKAHDLESSRMNLTFLFDDQSAYDQRRERFGYA